MKILILFSVAIAVLFMTGCVRSLQPFYERRDIYFDRSLVGTWSDAEGKTKWTIVPRDESDYVIDQSTPDGRKARFEARLFKIDEQSFLDLVPVPAVDIGRDEYFEQVIPGHLFLAVKFERCSSQMHYMDPTWLKLHLSKNPASVAHVDVDGQIILTDSTGNLQSFIKKHLSAPGAFETTETLLKKGDPQCEQKNF